MACYPQFHTVDCCATYLPQVAFWSLIFRRGLYSSLRARWSHYITSHRSDGPLSLWAIFGPSPIWLFLPERCASRLRVEVAFANQAAVDGPRRRRVRRGLHYSWAVILADLCTGEPVDGRSVVVLSGCVTQSIAAPPTSPKSPSGGFQEGTFFSPCQVVYLYCFTSFRWLLTVSFAPLGPRTMF